MSEAQYARTAALTLTEAQKKAALLVSRTGPLSRSEVARRLGVSRSNMSPELARLVQSGILTPVGMSNSTGGRKGERLAIADASVAVIAGVDIDVHRAEIAVTKLDGAVIARSEVFIEPGSEPFDVLLRCRDNILSLHTAELGPLAAIGVAIPADIDPKLGTTIAPPTMPAWAGVPIAEFFANEFGVPTFIDNDANVLALGEASARSRTGATSESFLVVKLSTGLGAGVIVDGRVMRGTRGRAGDVGHICVDAASTIRCTCGGLGCLEALAAAPALVRAAHRIAESDASRYLASALKRNGSLTLQDIGDASSAGDLGAIAIIQEAGARIGFVLAGLATFFDPSAVIVSSGLSTGSDLLLSSMREIFYQRAQPHLTRDLEITQSLFAEETGLFGAAILAGEGILGNPDHAGFAVPALGISEPQREGSLTTI